MTSESIDGPRRMGWLLATSRLLSPDTSALSREEFIALLRTEGMGIDASRLSRLESGAQRGSTSVLDAYERHTGSGPGVLHATDSLLARASEGRPQPATADREPHEIDLLLERTSRGDLTAHDWLNLANGLLGFDRVYIHRSTWAEVNLRLLSELARAVGPAQVTRHETAVQLLAHDRARGHLVRSLGRFVMDTGAQSVAPALAVLSEADDDAAAELLLRLMRDSRPLIRRGSADAVGYLAGRGRLDETQWAVVEQYAARQLAKGGSSLRRLTALDLAGTLPESAFTRMVATVPDLAVRRQALTVRRHHELLEPDIARSVSESAGRRVEDLVGRGSHDSDQMLTRLLREALLHGRGGRRQLAGAVLAASRYAPAVATVALELTDSEEEVLAGGAWSLVRLLGDVLTREEIADRAMAETRHQVRPLALTGLGACHGPLPTQVAERLAEEAIQDPGAAVRHSALLALGMAGDPILQRLAHVDRTRRGACWWLNVGPAVTDLRGPGLRGAG